MALHAHPHISPRWDLEQLHGEANTRNGSNECLDSLEIYERSVKLKRRFPSAGRTSSGRSVSKGFTPKQGKSFLRFAINCTWLTDYIVLTYTPETAPQDAAALKRDVNAVSKWLQRRGSQTVLSKIEFTKASLPHIHILSDGVVRSDLARYWKSHTKIQGHPITAFSECGVYLEPIEDYMKARGYLSKPVPDIPERYANGLGRLWGKVGRRPMPIYAIEAPRKEMAPTVRILIKYANANWFTGKFKQRNNGVSGFCWSNIKGNSLKTICKRLAQNPETTGNVEPTLDTPEISITEISDCESGTWKVRLKVLLLSRLRRALDYELSVNLAARSPPKYFSQVLRIYRLLVSSSYYGKEVLGLFILKE